MRRLANKISLAMEERKRLRRRSTLSIAIADRFSQLSAEGWRAATDGGSLFHSAAYQRMFERVRPPNVEPRFALISDGDAPVAAVCMQIVTLDHSHLGDLKRRRMLRKLGAKMRTRCWCAATCSSTACTACAAPRRGSRQGVAGGSEVIYRVRRAEKLAGSTDIVLLKDFDEAAREDSAVLKKLSYGAVDTEPNMVLTLKPAWRTHDDYLKSLSSKYRSDIKNRVFKKFDESGCSVERLTDVAAHATDLQRSICRCTATRGCGRSRCPPATGRGWRSGWRESACARGAAGRAHRRLHRQPEGWRHGVRLSHRLRPAGGGQGVPLYLRLLHASLAQAIEFGCAARVVRPHGAGAEGAHGLQAGAHDIWARHRHPLLNQLLQPMLKLVEHDDAPEFTPFK